MSLAWGQELTAPWKKAWLMITYMRAVVQGE
jgi:hypothetical protein